MDEKKRTGPKKRRNPAAKVFNMRDLYDVIQGLGGERSLRDEDGKMRPPGTNVKTCIWRRYMNVADENERDDYGMTGREIFQKYLRECEGILKRRIPEKIASSALGRAGVEELSIYAAENETDPMQTAAEMLRKQCGTGYIAPESKQLCGRYQRETREREQRYQREAREREQRYEREARAHAEGYLHRMPPSFWADQGLFVRAT